MALRIYLIGLVQFLVVALVIELDHRSREVSRRETSAAERAEDERRRTGPPSEAHAAYVAEDLAKVVDDIPALTREVERVAKAFGWSVDVKGPDGDALAHADPPESGPRGPWHTGATPSLETVRMRDGRDARLEYVVRGRPPGRDEPPLRNRTDAALGRPDGAPRRPDGGPPTAPPPPPFKLAAIAVLLVVGVGSWLTARSFARPLTMLSNVTRAFGNGALDARARMARGDEIGDVAKSFDDMANRIAELLLTERELLANVSHELRTPLARIRVALDLASEADPRTAVESFADIAQDLAELERIVDDVLASARLALDAGARSGGATTLSIRAERLDPRELLDRSVARFQATHPRRPLRLDLPTNLPSIVADPVLVRRVVDNLLDNADKYTEAEGRAITLQAHVGRGLLEIDIVDEGVGISDEDQTRLFEPFFRVDRSRTRATGGLGLGLVLARRVAEAHGGTLSIESKLGKGTRAKVTLPLEPAS